MTARLRGRQKPWFSHKLRVVSHQEAQHTLLRGVYTAALTGRMGTAAETALLLVGWLPSPAPAWKASPSAPSHSCPGTACVVEGRLQKGRPQPATCWPDQQRKCVVHYCPCVPSSLHSGASRGGWSVPLTVPSSMPHATSRDSRTTHALASRLRSMLAPAGRSYAQARVPPPAKAMHQVHTCTCRQVRPARAKAAQGSGSQRPGAWGHHTACWWRSAFWGMPQMSSRPGAGAGHMPGLHSQLLFW